MLTNGNYENVDTSRAIILSCFHPIAPSCYRAISHWFACNVRDFSEVTQDSRFQIRDFRFKIKNHVLLSTINRQLFSRTTNNEQRTSINHQLFFRTTNKTS